MSEITPGPWVAIEVGSYKYSVVGPHWSSGVDARLNNPADARLMSAAPGDARGIGCMREGD